MTILTARKLGSAKQMISEHRCRTLLWIGPRSPVEFRPIYDYYEGRVSQIAYRSSLRDALNREATSVDRIVFTRSHRGVFDWQLAERLVNHYGRESAVCLLGDHCPGILHTERFALNEVSRIKPVYWYDWDQIEHGSSIDEQTSKPLFAMVIAKTFSVAEPLLDLFEGAGTSASWTASPSPHSPRNIDLVVWDDSVARPSSSRVWTNRLRSLSCSSLAQHFWLTATPRKQSIDWSMQAGVRNVISKPGPLSTLESIVSELAEQKQSKDNAEGIHRCAA